MLIENWKGVLKRAWSVWAMIAAVIFSGLEVVVQFLPADALGIPQGIFAALAGAISALAILFRLLVQQGVSDADTE